MRPLEPTAQCSAVPDRQSDYQQPLSGFRPAIFVPLREINLAAAAWYVKLIRLAIAAWLALQQSAG